MAGARRVPRAKHSQNQLPWELGAGTHAAAGGRGGSNIATPQPVSPQPGRKWREQRGERLRGEGWALPAARADKGTPTHRQHSPETHLCHPPGLAWGRAALVATAHGAHACTPTCTPTHPCSRVHAQQGEQTLPWLSSTP